MQTADPMVIDGQVVHNSPLFRLQQIVAAYSADQEHAEFYAGDVLDVCATVDPKDKSAAALKESVAGKRPGDRLMLPIADVKAVVSLAKKVRG